jgi:hypothetical protein
MKCNKCLIDKSTEEFYKNKLNATGYLYSCIECIKEYRLSRKLENKNNYLKNTYNIDLIVYNKMLAEQNYKCAICKKHEDELKSCLCVDHCHTSNDVRGLLCVNCNHALGKFDDNIDTLLNAIKYLSKKYEK